VQRSQTALRDDEGRFQGLRKDITGIKDTIRRIECNGFGRRHNIPEGEHALSALRWRVYRLERNQIQRELQLVNRKILEVRLGKRALSERLRVEGVEGQRVQNRESIVRPETKEAETVVQGKRSGIRDDSDVLRGVQETGKETGVIERAETSDQEVIVVNYSAVTDEELEELLTFHARIKNLEDQQILYSKFDILLKLVEKETVRVFEEAEETLVKKIHCPGVAKEYQRLVLTVQQRFLRLFLRQEFLEARLREQVKVKEEENISVGKPTRS